MTEKNQESSGSKSGNQSRKWTGYFVLNGSENLAFQAHDIPSQIFQIHLWSNVYICRASRLHFGTNYAYA